jgi:hypothetical protein
MRRRSLHRAADFCEGGGCGAGGAAEWLRAGGVALRETRRLPLGPPVSRGWLM